MPTIRRLCLPFALVLLAACAADRVAGVDGTAPSRAAPSAARSTASVDPHFVQAAPTAPTIANPVVRFWAVRGQDRAGTMVYHAAPGAKDSVTFVALRVKPHSLWKRPDGSLVADGDSVLVTLTLVDARRLIVDCQPAGLLFDPHAPAKLSMSYANADDDLNGDGTIDAIDQVFTRALVIWRKEDALSPWLPLYASKNAIGIDEVEADIGGFTGYAIAY